MFFVTIGPKCSELLQNRRQVDLRYDRPGLAETLRMELLTWACCLELGFVSTPSQEIMRLQALDP